MVSEEYGAGYWDRVAEDWTTPRDRIWRIHSDIINAALLEQWLPLKKVRRLLKTDLFDEAVAEGVYPALRQHADQITGIDISPRIVAAACRRYPHLEGVITEVRELPFEDGRFDAVVSLSTLDHFDSETEILSALAELHRVLSRGGRMVITLDNGANPIIALRNRLPQSLLRGLGIIPYRVGATCTPARFAALLHAAGFEVQESRFTLHCPRLLAVVAARAMQQRVSLSARARFLGLLAGCERLADWPSRRWTGYFVAAVAHKQ
jgi:SAM-dependent methyltransferase